MAAVRSPTCRSEAAHSLADLTHSCGTVAFYEPIRQQTDIQASPERGRLASALATFWEDGSGPTHGELDRIFGGVGVAGEGSNKAEKVRGAVREVSDENLWELVDELIYSLRGFWKNPQSAIVPLPTLNVMCGGCGGHCNDMAEPWTITAI